MVPEPADESRLTETPQPPNLTTDGFDAPSSAPDSLLTLGCGVIQMATGAHLLGGLAAILHGAGRLRAPDSLSTKAMGTIRKALTPDFNAIQESVKLMAPLTENNHGGLRDALALAAHDVTGLDLAALKHQLFSPGDPLAASHPMLEPNALDKGLARMNRDVHQVRPRSGRTRRAITVNRPVDPEPNLAPGQTLAGAQPGSGAAGASASARGLTKCARAGATAVAKARYVHGSCAVMPTRARSSETATAVSPSPRASTRSMAR